MNNILIIGANGKVGRLIIKALVEKGKNVRAMIRSTDQSEFIQSLGASTIIGDLEKDFEAAFKNMECVIFTAGSGSHTGPDKTITVDQLGAVKSIDLAKKHAIKRYVMVSAQGARDPELPGRIQHYYKAKSIADEYLVQSGLNYTIFRPGKLLDDIGEGKIKVSENFPGSGTTRRADLASAIAEAIDIPKTENKILEIFDGNDDIAEALSI